MKKLTRKTETVVKIYWYRLATRRRQNQDFHQHKYIAPCLLARSLAPWSAVLLAHFNQLDLFTSAKYYRRICPCISSKTTGTYGQLTNGIIVSSNGLSEISIWSQRKYCASTKLIFLVLVKLSLVDAACIGQLGLFDSFSCMHDNACMTWRCFSKIISNFLGFSISLSIRRLTWKASGNRL